MEAGKGLLLLAGDDKEEETEESPDMLKTAIKTLFAAAKSGDVDAGVKAFKAAKNACESEEYSEEE